MNNRSECGYHCNGNNNTFAILAQWNVLLFFYSLFIVEFTYFMYKIVNKATFIVVDTIKAQIKKSIKLINTTSLSDNQSYLVQWQHISTTMFISYVCQYNIGCETKQYKKNEFSQNTLTYVSLTRNTSCYTMTHSRSQLLHIQK